MTIDLKTVAETDSVLVSILNWAVITWVCLLCENYLAVHFWFVHFPCICCISWKGLFLKTKVYSTLHFINITKWKTNANCQNREEEEKKRGPCTWNNFLLPNVDKYCLKLINEELVIIILEFSEVWQLKQ